jgi:methionyl-tRNA formyltransferase
MRLILMGTGPFAVPVFCSLLDSEQDILAIVTRPPAHPRGRSPIARHPVTILAEKVGRSVLEPPSVNAEEFVDHLRGLRPDLLVVCDYGEILSPAALESARLGGINLHGSLLPSYRGAAPVAWAIYDGRSETGVSVIHMTPLMDAGPMLVQRSTPIGPSETAGQLEARLAQLGVGAVRDAIRMLAAWDGQSPIGQPQDAALATRAPRLQKKHGAIDFRRTAAEIYDQVRAMQPWPRAFSYLYRSDHQPVRLLVDEVTVLAERHPNPAAGELLVRDKAVLVSTGDGLLRLERVQPEGKKPMTGDELVRGYRLAPGDRLGIGSQFRS